MRASRFAVLLALVLVGCAGSDSTVEVFAAASLAGAIDEVADAYEARYPRETVRVTVAGSSTLREQILDGAEADLFVSASPSIIDDLIASIESIGVPLAVASNRLVLAVPVDNPAGVADLDDLADSDLLVGVCARGVPCGDLAHQWITAEGVVVEADTAEADVQALTRRLAEAELDAAFVYATDVANESDITEAGSASDGPATTYPMVVLDDQATGFSNFLIGDEAQQILARWGFGRP